MVSFNRVLYILNLLLEMTTFGIAEDMLGYSSWTAEKRVTYGFGGWKWGS
jgi:hypothetical protein